MKLLVTGGLGFIGSNFIKYIMEQYPSYHIVNLDALTYAGNIENLRNLEDCHQYKFVRGDITDREFIFNLFKQESFDVVVNFAAESHVDRSIVDPSIFVKTNVQGTQTLLDAALEYKITKFVQISTDEVYGSLGKTGYFTEESPLKPNSPYSASKASADHFVRSYYETYGLPVCITRCSNNYGPFQHKEKLIPLMIVNALKDQYLPVYGRGINVRDWIYVEDHCSAIDVVIHNGRSGEVYNIGADNELTNIEVVKRILYLLDKPNSLISYVEDRLGHDMRYAIDSTKIKRELGWTPTKEFDDGLQNTVNWYISKFGINCELVDAF
ncbi:dTDP-glucose 4,6-dehydratase [Pontibacillus salicampi]|uniref:dTDP-glucose 4,6-dehydratase n=1 Tax=Pontibacillus salicampi TaxID=1449801 RepID=A0ABV6LT50_9BACI